jgi:hypothetical protein
MNTLAAENCILRSKIEGRLQLSCGTPRSTCTLYCSHSSKKAKRSAVENYAQQIAQKSGRVRRRVQQSQGVKGREWGSGEL